MPNQQLQIELISLRSKLSVSNALVSAARGQAGLPVTPNAPAVGLTALAQAVAAQQTALEQIQKVLEGMA